MEAQNEAVLTKGEAKTLLVRSVLSNLIPTILVVIGGCMWFYYTVTGAVSKNTSDIIEIQQTQKEVIEKINKVTEGKIISEIEIKNLNTQMTEIQQTQKEIYKILIDLKKGE